MNKKFLNYSKKKCMWCGCKFDFRPGKKFCCKNCNAFYWINEKKKKDKEPTQRKSRKKVLGYIKRRKDVQQFVEYLPLIKKFNKQFALHKKKKFTGHKLDLLNHTHKYLKSNNPSKLKQKISANLKILEGK